MKISLRRHRSVTGDSPPVTKVICVTISPCPFPTGRHLPLEGAVNFRDIGGYETADGAHVRWGVIYRADGLSELESRDLELLQERGIATVIDLRTSFERENGAFPVETVPVSFHHLPLMETVPDFESFRTVPGFLSSTYVDMVEGAGGQIAQAIEIMADASNIPLVYHCAVGKDRTGVLTAILLGILGVPHETIVADYALSTLAMDKVRDRLIARYPEAEEQIREAKELLSAEPRNMEFLLTTIEQQWGSIEAYAHHLGISAETCTALRSALLEA